MDLFKNTAFRSTEQAMDYLWLKQQTISHNIANATTPGYKAQRVDFENMLSAETVKDKESELLKVMVYEDTATSMRLDGNNVDMDRESIELAKAQIQYDYLLRKITGQFTTMDNVLREGR